ncbi:kinase [Pseudoalteromonas sp. H105]|uniref:kinase n=1 Tax=Pseudoalteromonas sp. H105 TaxID=1348393 RepID=UPI000732192D|nr:kinase [Pseudoalteromonas sp. H105]KTF16725.1 kinase [Pseudoalteromonas sp. H105]
MYIELLNAHFSRVCIGETITSLWSGCGEIVRCSLDDKPCVLKAINVPDHINHPRITQSAVAIDRKKHSYHVEYSWYRRYSDTLPLQCRALTCFNTLKKDQNYVLVFADFTQQGFTPAVPCDEHILSIVKWLAYFHAYHLNNNGDELWNEGNYWHLSTRPDEYANMPNGELKQLAHRVENKLNTCEYNTLIHGDAKLANFAINSQTLDVLGYDFQYVGKGVGIVDLMYFLGSCLDEHALLTLTDKYLDAYYSFLSCAIKHFNIPCDAQSVITQWQALWPYAWTDFYRFLAGWSPAHGKINAYMLKQYDTVIHYEQTGRI